MRIAGLILFLLFAASFGALSGKRLFLKEKEALFNTKVMVYHKIGVHEKKIADKAPPDRANPSGDIQKNYTIQKRSK